MKKIIKLLSIFLMTVFFIGINQYCYADDIGKFGEVIIIFILDLIVEKLVYLAGILVLVTGIALLILIPIAIYSKFFNKKEQDNELDENGNEIFDKKVKANDDKILYKFLKLFIIGIIAIIVSITVFKIKF